MADVEPGDGNHSQDDDERVEPVEYSHEEVERMIVGGEILDAKTLAAWTLYRLKRDA